MKIISQGTGEPTAPTSGMPPEYTEQARVINASNIGQLPSGGPDGGGTETLSPVTEALITTREEIVARRTGEAQEEARQQKAAIDAASRVEVQEQVKRDPLLKSATGTEAIASTVKVEQAHKDAFITSLLSNGRYTETVSLFGSKVIARLRSRTLGETDAIAAYLRRQVGLGMVRTSQDYSDLVRKVLLTAQVEFLNGVEYPPLKAPLYSRETDSGIEDPAWVAQMDIWEGKPIAIATAMTQCIAEFEARYWFMVNASKDANFWGRGESTAE